MTHQTSKIIIIFVKKVKEINSMRQLQKHFPILYERNSKNNLQQNCRQNNRIDTNGLTYLHNKHSREIASYK